MESPAQGQPDFRMMLNVALKEALSMAVEDSTGPWELLWDLRQQFPASNQSVLTLVARQSLIELAYTGLIRVVRWNPETNDEEELVPADLISALWLPGTWDTNASGVAPHIRFYATPAGQEAYYSHTIPA
jgi:hypothetical protein